MQDFFRTTLIRSSGFWSILHTNVTLYEFVRSTTKAWCTHCSVSSFWNSRSPITGRGNNIASWISYVIKGIDKDWVGMLQNDLLVNFNLFCRKMLIKNLILIRQVLFKWTSVICIKYQTLNIFSHSFTVGR